jgi:CRISPR-associated endonuclease/helicase Cas3
MEYFAHVRKLDNGKWDKPQSLEEHLRETAELAADFASEFNSREWGYVLGLAHDIFKSSPKWQAYLCDKSGYDEEASSEIAPNKIEHSAPSAKFVEEIFGKVMGRILSYAIAGHHAGLADWGGKGTPAELEYKLQNAKSEGIDEKFKAMLSGINKKNTPWEFNPNKKSDLLDMSLWIRMLFSCLVDADRLNTERYMDREKHKERSGYLTIPELRKCFNEFMETKTKKPQSVFDERLYYSRQKILEDCLKAAEMKGGVFSLSVPTGGGKTLSSMAFALKHAELYKKKRIIYVIPYTSIIEQNADVFRKVFGNDEIVEHHSNLNEEELTLRSRLAAENWDASIIVTTSVQFFESLFTAKSSRSRKLHNIANSVIILDEAQLIPTEFLEPILETMRLLTEHYNVSFVFCTATQPIFEKQKLFSAFPGLEEGTVREIIQDVPELYKKLERVSIEFPEDMSKTREWKDLAKELSAIEQVLCVVSDRKSCRELFSLMPEGSYHLSALMCAEHRSNIISEIKKRLDRKEVVRVISTQLVEAGVDIDFPVVYRALAGIDSIVQAAGRCNREGKLNIESKRGRVVVFKSPREIPPGILRKARETAESIILNGVKNLTDREVHAKYFAELYWKVSNLDTKGIINLLKPEFSSTYETRIAFKSASDSFKIIDDSKQRSIFVPYEEKGEELIELLKTGKAPERMLLRKLQRYTVSIYTNQFLALQKRGSLIEVLPEVFALNNKVEYNVKKGLLIEETPDDPEDFMT